MPGTPAAAAEHLSTPVAAPLQLSAWQDSDQTPGKVHTTRTAGVGCLQSWRGGLSAGCAVSLPAPMLRVAQHQRDCGKHRWAAQMGRVHLPQSGTGEQRASLSVASRQLALNVCRLDSHMYASHSLSLKMQDASTVQHATSSPATCRCWAAGRRPHCHSPIHDRDYGVQAGMHTAAAACMLIAGTDGRARQDSQAEHQLEGNLVHPGPADCTKHGSPATVSRKRMRCSHFSSLMLLSGRYPVSRSKLRRISCTE